MLAEQLLKKVYEAIVAQSARSTELYRYYDGDHPLRYSTQRLAKAFDDINTYFAENWCSVVVDAVLERIELQALTVANDQAATDRLAEIWARMKMAQDAGDVHEAALVTGTGYLIFGTDDEGGLEEYENDPALCAVVYDPMRPKVKLAGGKMWEEGKNTRLMLYLPDVIETYEANNRAKTLVAHRAFRKVQEEPNEWGEIPVFRFPVSRRKPIGELGMSILSLQDAINKLLADMMVSAEFTAFKQRVIITNANIAGLKNAPNMNWVIPAGAPGEQASSIQELGGATLTNFLEPIDNLAQAIAIISRTPKHYFFAQGGDPSGDALIALEAPLVKKAKRRMGNFGAVWQEVGSFLLRHGERPMQVEPYQIVPQWADAETILPSVRSQVALNYKNADVPTESALLEAGWSREKVDAMKKARVEEKSSGSTEAQEILANIRARASQVNDA